MMKSATTRRWTNAVFLVLLIAFGLGAGIFLGMLVFWALI